MEEVSTCLFMLKTLLCLMDEKEICRMGKESAMMCYNVRRMKIMSAVLMILALVLILMLMPTHVVFAEGEHLCPDCREPGRLVKLDEHIHGYLCENIICPRYEDEDNPFDTEAHQFGYIANEAPEYHSYVCNICRSPYIREPHSFGAWEDAGDGVNHKKACVCGRVEETEAHRGGTAYCNARAVCTVCNTAYGEVDLDNHPAGYFHPATCVKGAYCEVEDRIFDGGRYDPDNHPADKVSAATCTSKAYCSACETYFGDTDPANHTGPFEEVVRIAPDCTTPGREAGKKCTACGEYSEGGKEIPASGHDLTATAAKPETCTEDGNSAYWTCSVCKKHFSDAEGKTGIEKDSWIIPGIGHALIQHEAQAPTCTEIGWDAYDTCSRCDYTTYVEKAQLGHDLVHHDAQAPTCTEIGWDAYDSCSRCDYSTYVEKAKLGHDLVHHDAQAPTCTEIGWDAYDTCSRCDYSTYAEIPAKGHTEAIDPAVASTCTGTGMTEGKHCSVCGTVLAAQEVVPARGHTYGSWKPSAQNHHTQNCTRCGSKRRVDCTLIPVSLGDANTAVLCPICGYCEGTEDMTIVHDAKINGKKQNGRLIVYISGEQEAPRLLTVAFEANGKPVAIDSDVTIILPASLIGECRLLLIGPDGGESPVDAKSDGDDLEFTIRFSQDEQPTFVQVLRVVNGDGSIGV